MKRFPTQFLRPSTEVDGKRIRYYEPEKLRTRPARGSMAASIKTKVRKK